MKKKILFSLLMTCIVVPYVVGIICLFEAWTYHSEEKAYQAEQERFQKVLINAPDEELFLVLRYAIVHQYVPNKQIDPFEDKHVSVGAWQRSLSVYNRLRMKERKDLLRKIYPDLEVLDEYVNYGRQSGAAYPDTIVRNTILNNAGTREYLDPQIEGNGLKDTTSLRYRYFFTPRLQEYLKNTGY